MSTLEPFNLQVGVFEICFFFVNSKKSFDRISTRFYIYTIIDELAIYVINEVYLITRII